MGMLVGNGSSYFRPLQDTKILKREFIFVNFFVTLNKTILAKNIVVCLEHLKRYQKLEIYNPKRDDKHPFHFQKRIPPPQAKRLLHAFSKINSRQKSGCDLISQQSFCCVLITLL